MADTGIGADLAGLEVADVKKLADMLVIHHKGNIGRQAGHQVYPIDKAEGLGHAPVIKLHKISVAYLGGTEGIAAYLFARHIDLNIHRAKGGQRPAQAVAGADHLLVLALSGHLYHCLTHRGVGFNKTAVNLNRPVAIAVRKAGRDEF